MLSIFDAAISSPKYGELDNKEQPQTAGLVDGLSVPNFAYEIVDDQTICMDERGRERSYGECWRKQNDPCKICTCYNQDETRCESVECQARPLCSFGQRLVAEELDECCKSYRCVESKY